MSSGNFTIGITGGIGSGKSVVSRILRCNGEKVYDCDSRAKWLMNNDPLLKEALKADVGNEVYDDSGRLNRKYLADRLFADLEIRILVNSIVHEAVREDIERRRRQIEGLFFIESAILATAHLDVFCNQIWLINASFEERLKRIHQRDNLSIEEINKRIESQASELSLLPQDKVVVIENNPDSLLLDSVLFKIDKYKPDCSFIYMNEQ